MAPKNPLRKFPLSNTSSDLCFINVVLQILRYLAELSRRIYSYNGKTTVDKAQKERTDIAYDAVMSELRRIFDRKVNSADALRKIDNFLPEEVLRNRSAMDFLLSILHYYMESDGHLFAFKQHIYNYCRSCEYQVYTVHCIISITMLICLTTLVYRPCA